jgi:GT2 family glycosyltransferase
LRAAQGPDDELIVIELPPGLSPAAARNAGARQASGDVVVFVDSDVVVHHDALARIRNAFADGAIDALFGSYDDSPAAPGVVAGFRNLLHHHVHQSNPGPADTFWSGLGAIRRAVLEHDGGFAQDRYPHPSIEDIELGGRLHANGAVIVLDPAVQGTHLKAWTLTSMVATDFARRGVPWVALLVATGRVSKTLNLGWRHRLSALSAAALVAGLVVRRRPVVAMSIAAFVGLNVRFYLLLMRRRGPADAALGVALHLVHHLVGVAAVPAGVAAGLAERRSRRSP